VPRRPAAGMVPAEAPVVDPYILDGPCQQRWWQQLRSLDRALQDGAVAAVADAYAGCLRACVEAGYDDLPHALAETVLFEPSAWAAHVARATRRGVDPAAPAGIRAVLEADLAQLCSLAQRPWQAEVETLLGARVPSGEQLALPRERRGAAAVAAERLRAALRSGSVGAAVTTVTDAARHIGAGPLARHAAYVWMDGTLRGVAAPASARLGDLVGLEAQLEPFVANVEAFLAGRPALATLLYGPRGSGKSTTVRGLLERYADRGLRLVEVPVDQLEQLAGVIDGITRLPSPVVIMLDDLSFDADDRRLRPLKSLLEGSLLTQRERVLVVATSNRRHLVGERHGDRPDPLDADVHAWDTHHDRLALADRFGLTITFPSTDQRAYLAIVAALAEQVGLPADARREARALRFAAWGNGLSGRTARQFIDRELAQRDQEPGAADSEPGAFGAAART